MDRRLFAGVFLFAAAILLAACAATAPAPSPVATTPSAQPEVIPSGAETSPAPTAVAATHPALAVTVDASPETCAAMQTMMAETLGTEATWGTGPFVDPRTGQTGTACVITVTGTGVNFPGGTDFAAIMAGMQALGWTNLVDYSAGGAQTNMAGFEKGDELCVYTEHWQPAPEVTCPENQPIGACEMEPEQRLWTITMECVDRAPTPPA
jgi:cytochrome c5